MMEAELTEDQARAQREREAREANQKRNNERLDRLNNIANQADQTKTADGLEDLDDEAWSESDGRRRPTPQDRPEREQDDDDSVVAKAEKADRELDEARAAGADDVRVTNGQTYYRIIVNGQERWLTLQQLRDTSSKVTAADDYLRQAKESAKSLLSAPPSDSDEVASSGRARTRELLNRALMGEQEAIDELAQVLERPSVPDVAKLVDERVDGRLTFREAVSWFDREYAQELKDPRVKDYMVWKDSQLAAANPDMDFKERLRQVGEEARALRGRSTVVSQPEPSRSQKEQRKASVRALPQAAGRQVDEADEEEDETYESAIQKMAKARGQLRPVIHKR